MEVFLQWRERTNERCRVEAGSGQSPRSALHPSRGARTPAGDGQGSRRRRPWRAAERREEERPTRRSPWEVEGRSLKGLTAFAPYVTECYFQFRDQFFNGTTNFWWYFSDVAIFQCYETNFPYLILTSILL
ncbi:hypothetical protein GQ55_7G091100 [Panicum hallii var. hallii]|uniref:Uncharacterized protein n=1 Tax=Panicum hallii var. hallii TaxID=1504633 RepID=A0A2T7CTE9_9POAL|nr:hypothetical protein GQ55_7G091100 [Panicum hallii var. hallii]